MKNDSLFGSSNDIKINEDFSSEDHSIIADDLPVLLCRFRADGDIFFVNKAFAKFFNTSKENLQGTKFFIEPSEFTKVDSNNPFLNRYKKEFSLKLADNSIHWIEWTINRIVDKNSDGFEYQAVGHDISEHKLVDEQLSKISVAVEQSKSTVVITDLEGNIEYVNPRFTEITGYTHDEALGKHTRILKSNQTDPNIYTELWSTISNGIEWHGELLNKKKNGELFWELVSIAPVKDSNGEIMNYVAIKEDISEYKKSEKLEKTLYQISQTVIDTEDLNELYTSIHKSLSEVIPVENLFIALYDKEKDLLSFPYFVDEFDEPYETAPPDRGLTEYVLRTGEPLHVDQVIFKTLVDAGEVDLYGTDSLDWIGVPLKIGDNTIGVLVVQSYSDKIRLGERELNVLIYVSGQIALAIERTKTNNLLKIREERYRLLFDKAADLIAIIDIKGKVLDINNLFEEETGYKRTDVIGKNIFSSGLLTPKSAITSAFYLSQLIVGKDVPIFEIDGIKNDGSSIIYELRAVPIKEKDKLVGVQAILRNITERKKTAVKLQQNEKQLSNLMSNLPGMAYRCRYDHDWTMEFISQGCLELTGYLPEELILNKKISFAELIHPEDKEKVFVTVHESVNKKTPYQIIYRIRTKGGGEKWVWEKGNSQISKKGKVEALEGFIADISSRINAEEALKESEQLYKKLIATLPDIITITNLKGEILFLNEIGIKFSGYENFEEVKNKNIMSFIANEDKARGMRNFKDALTKKIEPQEYKLINKNKDQFIFEIQREVLRSADKSPYGLIFSMRDITFRKESEKELAQSEEKYRTLIDSIQDGVFLVVKGKISFVNRAFCNMIGYNLEEVEGVSFTKFIDPEDYELVVGNYQRRLEGKPAPSSYEGRMIHKNDKRVYVNMTARVINYKGEKSTIGTIKDITVQKELEQVLLNQKNLFKGVADAANILLTERNFDKAIGDTLESLGQSSDIDRVYIFENDSSSSSTDPITSQRYEWTNGSISSEIDNPELQNLHYYPMFESWYPVLQSGGIINSLVKDLNPALRELLSEEDINSILLVPIMVKNQFWGFIGFDYCKYDRIWSDSEISILQTTAANLGGLIEREIVKKELIEAKETAEEMSRLKSNFLANMSHELRTPLIGILGYAEILKVELEGKEWNEMVSTIAQSGKRLLETLNLILDLSKVESDKVQINYSEINIVDEINDIVNLLGPIAKKKNLYLKSFAQEEVIYCRLDKRVFHSIITNLVNNSLKYTNKGGITIDISLLNENEKNNVIIKVIDTGIGIPKKDHETIFDEFRQVSEGYNRNFEGSGLGLTIAKKFTEKMHGSIFIESEVDHGSTFTVVFPQDDFESKIKVTDLKGLKPGLQMETEKRKKALVVDDDNATRQIIKLFLEAEIEVETAANGAEALKLLNSKKYTIVLLDISLGNSYDGVELLRDLRTIPYYKNIPVIAVTAHAMVGDRARFLAAGFDDYLSKPFAKEDLVKKVKNWADVDNNKSN